MGNTVLRIFFIMIALSLIGTSGFAQRRNGESHGIGAGGTVFKTWGFLYRKHFPNRFGISTSIGGWLSGSHGHLGHEISLNYTFAHEEFDWTIIPNSSIRVYLSGFLANILYRNDPDTNIKNAWDPGLGVGPGLEFFFNRHFAIHLELPWMTFLRIGGDQVKFHSSHPHFGGGIVYYF